MSTRLNALTYHNVNRARSELDMAVRFSGAEHVALAAEGADQFRGMVFIDLPAKALGCTLRSGWKRDQRLRPKRVLRSQPGPLPDQRSGQDSRAGHIP